MKKTNPKLNPLTPLLPQLRGKGVFTAKIKYSGSGDEGLIDNIDCTDENDKAVKISKKMEEFIINAVLDLLDKKYSGWEISDGENDGADGTITLMFSNESWTMKWCHNAHSICIDSHTHEESL